MKRMRLISLIIMAFVLVGALACQKSAANTINFNHAITSTDEMLAEVAASGKMGLFYFTSDNCGPCKLLQRDVFTDSTVIAFVDENFLPYWVNRSLPGRRDISERYDIHAVPTMVMVDPDGGVMDKIIGYDQGMDYRRRLAEGLAGTSTLPNLAAMYEDDPENAEFALEYAMELVSQRSYNTALPIFEQLKDSFEDKYSTGLVYYNLAYCYQYSDQTLANSIFEEGIEKDLFTDDRNLALASIVSYNMTAGEYQAVINYAAMVPPIDIQLADLTPEEFHDEYEEFRERNRSAEYAALAYYKVGDPEQGKIELDQVCRQLANEYGWSSIAEFGQMCIGYEVGSEDILPWTKLAIENSPYVSPYFINSYARNLGRSGRYEEAITAFEEELRAYDVQLGPDSVLMKDLLPERYLRDVRNTTVNILVVNLAAGNQEVGNNLLEQVLKDYSEPLVYRQLMLSAAINAPLLPDALDWGKSAMDLANEDKPFYMSFYARLLYKNGKVQEAVDIIAKAHDLSDQVEYELLLREYKAAL